jgi:uncharacterized protein (DUF305 family)
MKKLLGLVAMLVTAFALTACGADTSDGEASDAQSSAARFNDADVKFAQSMIPHHRQAVQMAQLAGDRAQSREVKQLAADIEAAQRPEIEQLTTWLEEWGQDVPQASTGGSMKGMKGMKSGMGGTMSAKDMGKLAAASGAEFDQMFLKTMVEHHKSAVEMAKVEVADGENSGAIKMAERIVSTQQAEIEKMERLLSS